MRKFCLPGLFTKKTIVSFRNVYLPSPQGTFVYQKFIYVEFFYHNVEMKFVYEVFIYQFFLMFVYQSLFT